jgi:hypothetical protein
MLAIKNAVSLRAAALGLLFCTVTGPLLAQPTFQAWGNGDRESRRISGERGEDGNNNRA